MYRLGKQYDLWCEKKFLVLIYLPILTRYDQAITVHNWSTMCFNHLIKDFVLTHYDSLWNLTFFSKKSTLCIFHKTCNLYRVNKLPWWHSLRSHNSYYNPFWTSYYTVIVIAIQKDWTTVITPRLSRMIFFDLIWLPRY